MRRLPSLAALALAAATWAAPEKLELKLHRLELPGPVAQILPLDRDGDGDLDLALVVAFVEVGSISEDRYEEMMQISTVVPAYFNRRELWWAVRGEDGYAIEDDGRALPEGVVALAGSGRGLIAMTHDGIARIADEGEALVALPLASRRSLISGADEFLADLDWTADLDGDGRLDAILPLADGAAFYLQRADGSFTLSDEVHLPRSPGRSPFERGLRSPWPATIDLDGDGDLDVRLQLGSDTPHLFLGDGRGGFAPAYPEASCEYGASALSRLDGSDGARPVRGQEIGLFDLDGDGRVEALVREQDARDGDGLRTAMREAKRPRQAFELYRLDERLRLAAEPYARFTAEGHPFDLSALDPEQGQVRDLDGDGRAELIFVTLDFSMLQAVRVLVARRLSIGLDFHVWRQNAEGSFVEVPDLDLSERLKLNLNRLDVTRFAQFGGDFDGDGRVDFIHLGRGSRFTIHRGLDGARYPDDPDVVVELEGGADSLEQVEVRDFDGDGRADLAISHPLPPEREGETPPIALDLYLGSRR